jgi:hypothetical protein
VWYDSSLFHINIMSKTVLEIFKRLQEKREQARVIKKKYSSELASSGEYQKITEDLDRLRAKKKVHEKATKEQAGANFARLDELKLAISQDAQMLSDVALTAIMKGEPVQVKDEGAEYEPVFTVRFRKIK